MAPEKGSGEPEEAAGGAGPEGDCAEVAVVLERRVARRGPLTLPSWQLGGVLTGPVEEAPGGRCIHRDGEEAHFLWTGLPVRLDPGASESYWFNLVGRRPSLLVVCRPHSETGLAPVTVTADHDLGGAHMEADDTVFAAPLPETLVPWLERYVMANYRPRERKQRKRKNWKEEQGNG